ncbi:hypothetical protein PR048_013316 [Dryococelus australis]|uniref:Cadherin domain-containing protein n=1 Tax=Dryococelus australis TaxID=614101 RepID=A0ABQ9HRU3_9NEOP|nr:hypothetical protein PR048_013316 [Dryococelus australis]
MLYSCVWNILDKRESVANVTANDPDEDAVLEYSIIEPIRATDRTGLPLKSTAQHIYKDWFKINSLTGEITVAQPLDHNVAAVIIFTVQAKDLNAKENIELQTAKAEVTVYIQAYSNSNPVFTLHGWSGKNNVVKLKVPEEQPVGTVLFRLTAKDPMNNKLIKRYEKLKHETKTDIEDFFNISVQSGDVILNKRLDFEQLHQRASRSSKSMHAPNPTIEHICSMDVEDGAVQQQTLQHPERNPANMKVARLPKLNATIKDDMNLHDNPLLAALF